MKRQLELVGSTERPRVGEILLRQGLITPENLSKALVLQGSGGGYLGELLVSMGAVSAEKVLEVLSKQLNTPAVNLDYTYGDPLVLDLIPKGKAFELNAIPLFQVENRLTVALADPNNLNKITELQFLTGKHILPVLALENDIRSHLPEYYGEMEKVSDETEIEFETNSGDPVDDSVAVDQPEADRPIVRLVNLILARAIQEEASDIHMEPQRTGMVVRYRIDGDLREKPFKLSPTVMAPVVSRLKILATIDISERRVPQDGKLRVKYQGRRIDVRMSTFPTVYGEKVVMRLLDKERQNFQLDNIGMSGTVLEMWKRLLTRKEGILLVTGPTGSGKSSTLFASLKEVSRPEVNIVTLEDPVEYELTGISQGQVSDRAGFTFAKGLRSILRQDPDIILVGEIRDLETAQISVQAALTGHLVLSTLHTNDAPSAVTRLVDMGMQPFLVASGLIGVLAQRLLRRSCPHCLESAEPTSEEADLLKPWLSMGVPFHEGRGCDHCGGVGYKGRVGVHELLTVNEKARSLITAGASQTDIVKACRG
ncbi:MAG: Flp pilus assembly complex ATPase component TadA, partial [Thermoanaerobaculales bacterium]|nr:Flp pilus assembly complex ATPase component TadA [Thermoanaerobaculales bacterium]